MKRAAVIGDPIAHSRSPELFALLKEAIGLPELDYRARRVSADELDEVLAELRASDAALGFNVTLPHKVAILPHLDALADEARAVGAVNVVRKDGARLVGHNTDVTGVLHTLDGTDLGGRACLVWGSGGAARAVVHALGLRRAETVLIAGSSATSVVATASARFPQTRFVALPAALPRLSLVVNATPLGMHGKEQARDGRSLDEVFAPGWAALEPGGLAFDLIYDPPTTRFMALAESHGFRAVGGLPMLIEQALEAWTLWLGPIADRDRARARVDGALRARRAGLPDARPIFLTGMMGAGKSTVGEALARRMGYHFRDTDREIERRAGRSIAAIFAEEGEAAFRAIERAVVGELARPATVVSLGGGALLDPSSLATVERGHLVWLTATIETLMARLGSASDRPLLSSPDRRQRLEALLREREPVYRRAHIQIATDGLDPAELAATVQAGLSKDQEESR